MPRPKAPKRGRGRPTKFAELRDARISLRLPRSLLDWAAEYAAELEATSPGRVHATDVVVIALTGLRERVEASG